MGGLGDGSGYVEMTHGFRARPRFREPSPAGIPAAGRATAAKAVSNEIDIRVIFIRGPVLLKIVQESGPVVGQAVFLEVVHGERKAVVNAYQRGVRLGEALHDPLCNLFASPVPAGAGRGSDLARLGHVIRHVDAQTLETGLTRFRASVVDSNVP